MNYCSLFLRVNYFSLHFGIFFKGKIFSQAQLILRWSKGSFILNFKFGNVRYSEEALLFEGSIKSFNKYHILDTSFLGLKIKTWASYQSKLKARICPSSPTAKAAEKEHKDNKKNNFSPFLGSIGWKQECATKRSEIVRVDELSKLTNGVVFVFGCVFVYEYSFGSFWSNFCLISSSYWFYDHFFAWNHGTQICFYVKHKNMVKN